MIYFHYFFFLLWITLEETVPEFKSATYVRDSIRKQLDGVFEKWMNKTDKSKNK